MAGIKKWFDGVLCVGALMTAGLASVASADAVGGSGCGVYRVEAFSTNVHYVTAYGGQEVSVEVNGDNDTDLDVFVYDEFGNLVDWDNDELDLCLLSWYPRWTGTFRVEVVNLGSVYNEYTICVE